jgi:hypothetical protein
MTTWLNSSWSIHNVQLLMKKFIKEFSLAKISEDLIVERHLWLLDCTKQKHNYHTFYTHYHTINQEQTNSIQLIWSLYVRLTVSIEQFVSLCVGIDYKRIASYILVFKHFFPVWDLLLSTSLSYILHNVLYC